MDKGVNRPVLVPDAFWNPGQMMVLPIFLRRQIIQGFMRAFTVIFWRPSFRDSRTSFSVLRRFTWLDKVQFYCMFLCPFSHVRKRRPQARASGIKSTDPLWFSAFKKGVISNRWQYWRSESFRVRNWRAQRVALRSLFTVEYGQDRSTGWCY